MFIEFFFELRTSGVPVGMSEALALARALSLGLHESTLLGFYHVARAVLVHTEAHLDAFDEAFGRHFRGALGDAAQIRDEILRWVESARARPELTPLERALLAALSAEEVERIFQERAAEQTERHDGGNHWIGTGGTSPFGRNGQNPRGIGVGAASGAKSALRAADARAYRGYRGDVVLDVRQLEVALRKLRAFAREGAHRELDLERTIDETAQNAGELSVVTRPPRRPNTRVILLMDVGGSMDPYTHLMSQLFSAAKRATHWKELKVFYFHNCIYGSVYPTEHLQDPVSVSTLLAETARHYKLVLVGDALMSGWELLGSTLRHHQGREAGGPPTTSSPGIDWLLHLRQRYDRTVWLNPEPIDAWPRTTIATIAGIFPMFPLTLDGLSDAIAELTRGTRHDPTA